MNKHSQYINNRLNLRTPQAISVEILEKIADILPMSKETNLKEAIEKIHAAYPIFKEFERNFPSICFSIATGVGKTRLMGAFIAYLYMAKGIKNFFVLAPNLTVYNKLIKDFRDSNSPKFVFKGLADFTHNPPTVITGDDYEESARYAQHLGSSEIVINVFNISKINAETKGGKEPRIKRLSEYIGKSYFDFLVSRPDLVMLMDESHHYRADRGMQVINELNPVLGLEVTATPQVEKRNKSIKFKNVVYEYSLAKAIRDGFVKEPAVATRKNFDPNQYNDDELDRIKIMDGIKVHIETQVEIEKYARDNRRPIIKPFILVVAKDTEHAKKLKEFIMSKECYDGYYADKVMDIHSNQSGREKDENIEKLITLEDPNNKIEIVIHVNMLKEGWDVTNLYTIIPLRASASATLTEQTIGRGLRLPYGVRTKNPRVDRLTIVSHDKFAKIVEEANKENSLIKKENIIEIDDVEENIQKEVITVPSKVEQELFNKSDIEETTIIRNLTDGQEKLVSSQDFIKEVYKTAIDLNKHIKNLDELKNDEIVNLAISSIETNVKKNMGSAIPVTDITPLILAVYNKVVDSIVTNAIPIPRVTIQQIVDVKWGFHDFDLNTKNLNYQPSGDTIIIKELRQGNVDVIDFKGNKLESDSLENIVIKELLMYSEIDYDTFSDLLYKLVNQAIEKFRTYLDEVKVAKVIVTRKKDIAQFIYTQMKEKFYYEVPDFQVGQVIPYTKIESNNLTKFKNEKEYNFRDTIEPKSDIPKKIFGGFKKSCHSLYKFDGNTEKLFSILLEDDSDVLRWLRPAKKQFNIYWDRDREHLYEPDFIVETATTIYMVETKAKSDLERSSKNSNDEINLKAKAGCKYCRQVSQYSSQNEGKQWKYLLIPHDVLEKGYNSFDYLAKVYEYIDKDDSK